MPQRVGLIVSVLLIVAACTGAETGVSTTPTTLDPGPIAGRLATLDGAGNVVVVEPDGSGRVVLTDDAGQLAAYVQPIWSPGADRVAFAQFDAVGFGVRIEALDGGDSSVTRTDQLPFYMFWSPTGETIAILRNGSNGLDLEMIDVAGGSASVLSSGAPFYFSWEPLGDSLISHVGEGRFETLGPSGAKADIGQTDPGYLAPQWTPAGIVHVAGGNLVIQEVGGDPTPIVGVGEFTTFVANPAGTKVALQVHGETGVVSVALRPVAGALPNRLVVVDVETGEVEDVTSTPAIGFFWSPDGESLLYLTPGPDGNGWDVEVWSTDGSSVEFGRLVPSEILAMDLIPFFPQYAQSMSFWSPDSRAFALPGAIDGEQGIWVYDIAGRSQERVADGTWVAWSG
jgi:hypothetical protein